MSTGRYFAEYLPPVIPNVDVEVFAPVADAAASTYYAHPGGFIDVDGIAEATASAYVPTVTAQSNITVAAPMADASAIGVAPYLELRYTEITTHHRLAPVSLLGETAHIIVSPSGQVDYPIIGDWTADESDMGGFQSASGTINAIDVRTKPEIYRYGAIWRAFHIQTGELEWAGMLMDPQIEGGNAQLSGRGWGQVFAERNFDYLLYQSIGTEGWVTGDTPPFSKLLAQVQPFLNNARSGWTMAVQDHSIKWSRNKSQRTEDVGFADIAIFYAPQLIDGEQLTRIAFDLVADGLNVDSGGGGGGATLAEGLVSSNVQSDLNRNPRTAEGLGGAFTAPPDFSGATIAEGPTAPHFVIYAGNFDEESGQNILAEVLHVHINPDSEVTKWDVDLLSGWASGGPHLAQPDSGSQGSWSGRPYPPNASALVSDPGFSYTAPPDGAFDWLGEVTDATWNFQPTIFSLPTRHPVNIIAIYVYNGHYTHEIGGTVHMTDDPSSSASITIKDIRVNGIAQGDHMSAGEIARDICTRLGLPTPYVDGGGWNVLPYVVENQTAGDVLTYLATISNRRFRFLDSGARPYLEFGHYGDHRFTIADERQPVRPLPLERYDRVVIPMQVGGVAGKSVRVHLNPSPLPRRHDYGRIELDQAFRDNDAAERFGEDLLDHLSVQRFGGDGDLVEVTDENGIRRSARVLHAGDVVRHAATDSNHMRISGITRSNGAVSVTFADQPPIVERMNDRRSKHLERTHNRHARS